MWNWFSLFALIAVLVATEGVAATVREESGIIVYRDDVGHEMRIGQDGKSSHPVLSPDGHQVAYLRTSAAEADGPDEIWLWRGGAEPPQRLLVARASESIETSLSYFNNLLFSSDGRALYFLSRAWAVSDALHVIDLSSGRERYVIDANDVRLAPQAHGKELLIVQRHKYPRAGGGATDDYWLVTPEGKELRRIGGDEVAVDRFVRRQKSEVGR
jgi:hypothetical protein